ncbi:MAG: radical SAM protein [Coriobacteriales bacterium]|jgi:MoaA/NifB/PqqE/SkfB family radical SAM enzyme|nr:radical SAM protein [Coriobacteriales bacterium]
MSELSYYMKWYFQCRFLGKRKPLQSVVFITDRCNLNCKHCNVVKDGPDCVTKTLDEVRADLRHCYDAGSRIVDFEGGEPHLWRDASDEAKAVNGGKPADINTLIDMARDMGFFSTTVTTNAQMPIIAKSDLIWVSIDGLREEHDFQRGEGAFDKAMANIDACDHPNLNVNMVVTSHNWQDFEKVAKLVKDHPKLHRFSFSFYVPYESRDLLPTREQRSATIDTALRLKAEGYPIMNSKAALKLLRDPQNYIHKRQCWISNFTTSDGNWLATCPGEAAGVCDDCGFGMGAEMTLLWNLHPSMVKAGLTLRGV